MTDWAPHPRRVDLRTVYHPPAGTRQWHLAEVRSRVLQIERGLLQRLEETIGETGELPTGGLAENAKPIVRPASAA